MFSARCALRGVSRQLTRRPAALRVQHAAHAKVFHSKALAATVSSRGRMSTAMRSARHMSTEELEDEDDDDEDYDDEEPSVHIGELAPYFEVKGAYKGEVQTFKLSDFEGRWLLLFFYPLNFTFVCPTEILEFSEKSPEFEKLGCQVLGASVDSQFSHLAWMNMPQKQGGLGGPLNFPLLADNGMHLSNAYNALNVDGSHAIRATYLIDPQGVLRHISMNDPPVGRNVDEYLRLVKAFQFADENGEVCPANWTPGADTIKPDPKASLEYFEKAGKN